MQELVVSSRCVKRDKGAKSAWLAAVLDLVVVESQKHRFVICSFVLYIAILDDFRVSGFSGFGDSGKIGGC